MCLAVEEKIQQAVLLPEYWLQRNESLSDIIIDGSSGTTTLQIFKDESLGKAARFLALSDDFLVSYTIFGNALFGLSQSAACTPRDRIKRVLQQQERYTLDHVMFASKKSLIF